MQKPRGYWLRLFGVGLGFFYILFVVAYAWITADMMISPSHHPICCNTPADFGAEFETVTLLTKDGLKLYGWYIPSTNGTAVILLHGYGGDRTSTLAYAKMLNSHGYGVLLYDQRASGESEGETRSWGWLDVWDVESAIGYLKSRNDVNPKGIGIMGCSTGAEIAIGAGAQFQDIQVVIADGAYYTTASDSWPPYEFKDWVGWPVYPFLITFMELKSGASAPMSLREAASLITPRHLMLIAAGENGYEQVRAQSYYDEASEPKEYWVVEGASHCGGHLARPEEYKERITSFFDESLLK